MLLVDAREPNRVYRLLAKSQETLQTIASSTFCQEHLKWGWGVFCVNGCTASPQCPRHHTGISCTIL